MTVSSWLIAIMVVEYIVVAAVCVFEGNWPRMLYWTCAAGINLAVLWGMK